VPTSLNHLVGAIFPWGLRSCDHICQVGVILPFQFRPFCFSFYAVRLFLRRAITLYLFQVAFHRRRVAHGHLRGSQGSDVYQADGT